MTYGDWIAFAALAVSVLITGGGTAWKLNNTIRDQLEQIRERYDKEAAQEQMSRLRVLQRRPRISKI